MRVFLILIAFLALLSHQASAEELTADVAEIVKGFPPELMFEGKPVDPDCIKPLLQTSGYPQDLTACGPKAKRLENAAKPADGLVVGDNDDIGYDYTCGDKDCGSFFYRYVGPAEGAMAIATEYTDKDGRTFTALDIIKRDGDKLVAAAHMTGGERCRGGLAGAPKVTDGKLLYGFNTTPYGFVNHYATDKLRVSTVEITDCSTCCFGRFSMEGSSVREIDFQASKQNLIAMRRGKMQDCFNNEYGRVEQKTLTDAEARVFAEDTIKKCKNLIQYQ